MKKLISVMMISLIVLSVFFTYTAKATAATSAETHPADSLWVEPSTIPLNPSTVDVGYTFNVTTWVNLSSTCFSWQVDLLFDTTYLNVTKAGYTGGSQSLIFYGHSTIPVNPIINNDAGSVMYGESLIGADSAPVGSGSLCWIEFVLEVKPSTNLTISFSRPYGSDTFVLNPDLDIISVPNIYDAFIIIQGETPPVGANDIWLEPRTRTINVSAVGVGFRFNVSVWVNLTDSSFTWQVGLLFNATHLSVTRADYTGVSKSLFFAGHSTIPISPSIDNVAGSVLHGESLIGTDFRAAGSDSLFWVEFELKAVPATNLTISFSRSDTFVLNGDLNELQIANLYAAQILIVGSQQPPPPSNTMWIEPSSLVFSSPSTNVGDKFNVTVWTSLNVSAFVWQVKVRFDPTQIQAVRASYTGSGKSQYFTGHSATIPVTPSIDNAIGYVMHGESLVGTDEAAPTSASLFWIEFQIMAEPTNGTLSSVLNITNTNPMNLDTFWLASSLDMIPLALYNADYSFTATVDRTPPTIGLPMQAPPSNVQPNQPVTISVSVTDSGSGVMNVALLYSINSASWNTVFMNFDQYGSGLWVGTILGQPAGTFVRYQITAYDNADNFARNDNYGQYFSYAVVAIVPVGPSAILIEPPTLAFKTDTASIGGKFNVTVWANMSVPTFAWQVKMYFNSTQIAAARAGYTAGSTSAFFIGHSTVPVTPIIDNAAGFVLHGESLIDGDSRSPGGNSLFWVEFQIVAAPPIGGTLSSVINITNADTFWLDNSLNEIQDVTKFNASYFFSWVGAQVIHDVAIMALSATPNEVVIGGQVYVSITVVNEGTAAETFDVTCYYDNSTISTINMMLAPNASRVLTFTWDTSGVSEGVYTISAHASFVPGETHTADNTFINGRITVKKSQPPPPYIVALVKFTPQKLNLKSKGKWITAHIKFIGMHRRAHVDVSTILLNSTIPAYSRCQESWHSNIEIKFDRSEVINYIRSQGITHGRVALTITGKLRDGTLFMGTGIIRVGKSGDVNCDGKMNMRDISLIASRFGQDNYDRNEDGRIDIKDIAASAKTRNADTAAASRKFGAKINSDCDVNEDGKFNMKDINIAASNYGKTYA